MLLRHMSRRLAKIVGAPSGHVPGIVKVSKKQQAQFAKTAPIFGAVPQARRLWLEKPVLAGLP